MTFAAFAQEQRHRTLKHRIEYPVEDTCSTKFYIPPILDRQPNTYHKEESTNDFTDLLSSTENGAILYLHLITPVFGSSNLLI